MLTIKINFAEILSIKKFFNGEDRVSELLKDLVVPNGAIVPNINSSNVANINSSNIANINSSNAVAQKLIEERKRKNFNIATRGKVWKNIYPTLDDSVCKICEINIMKFDDTKSWHMGHVQAFSKNGSDDDENLRPICRACNLSMGNKNMKFYTENKFSAEKAISILKSLKLI